MAANDTGQPTVRNRALWTRASFVLGLFALVTSFVLCLMGKMDGANYAFVAIAVAGGQHVVNGIERRVNLS